ncbi:MAG: DUF4886 domain-containing protein [Sedimentibacter sp.]|uniref:DUF4886 domain-containing protein n=1 Tax=Sedimentibacter sp. TaxID=1960295 RepID=UPI0031585D32
MTKKIIASLLLIVFLFFAAVPAPVYGADQDIKSQTEFMQRSLKSIMGFSNASDLVVDKAGTTVENKVFQNLYIGKSVKNGKITLKNVIVTGELIVGGTGQNTLFIQDSSISRLSVDKRDGTAKITATGKTSIDRMLLKSDAVVEHQKLTGSGFNEISMYKDTAVSFKTDTKTSFASSNKKTADINKTGAVKTQGIGETDITAKASSQGNLIFCKLKVVEPEIGTIKILAIGNSFSNDTISMVHDIANSAGISVVTANLNFNGCSLETHWKNASENNAYYSYQKWTSSLMTSVPKKKMEDAILDEDWDYIILQQYSGYSGIYSTYKPYLSYLSSYVRKLAPDAAIVLNMTWAYASDSSHAEFHRYNSNQNTMYKSITNAYTQASKDSKIDIVIPCGTAIQNARTSKVLNSIGKELTRDGFHLDEKTGRYIAGLTVFETLIVKDMKVDKDLYEDVSFVPEGTDQETARLAKTAVANAVKNPYKVTPYKTKAYKD